MSSSQAFSVVRQKTLTVGNGDCTQSQGQEPL